MVAQAAVCNLSVAGEPDLAAKILGQAAEKPGASDEVQWAAHLQRAEAMLAQGKYEEPAKLLIELTDKAGPVGTKAKLKLALAHLVEGKRLLGS